MSKPIKISIIIGSTRPNRFSEKPAQWMYEIAKQRTDIEVELLDLRDYPMPFYNEPVGASGINGNYSDAVAKKWAGKIGEADGYIMVTPEYNHGYPAVLKNALDYVYPEWNNKAVGFVSWGSVGGGRGVEQLREVAVELQMAPVRQAVHIFWDTYTATNKDGLSALDGHKAHAEKMLDQLVAWSTALKTIRS